MKNITTYITEKLILGKSRPNFVPKNREELINLIENEISKNGNNCSLNHIDITNITDLSHIFSCT